ncbi:MAG: hypothetical protein NDI77_00330 [Geobacteraceae bacterium]|nr:hypothetical protein [Geobacteraceae bacterium]
MKKMPRYCTHIMAALLVSLFLAACGDDSSTTSVTSETSTEIFYSHSVAVLDQVPLAWGYNEYGQLGNNSSDNSSSPVAVQSLLPITGMAAGGTHTVAFGNNSTAWAWGNNGYGQLGNNSTTASSKPVQVVIDANSTPLTKVIAVAAGGNHTLALDGDGVVWAWGQNDYGQLGDGTDTDQSVAVPVLKDAAGAPLPRVKMIAAGGGHSLALLEDGTVLAWGHNGSGQLGDGATSTDRKLLPVRVVVDTANTPLTRVVAIAAGGSHSLALDEDGTVWAWGYNALGQLGNGDSIDRRFAVKVPGFVGPTPLAAGVVPLAAGLSHSLAIDGSGNVRAWGLSFYGQLGNGKSRTKEPEYSPVQVVIDANNTPLTGVTAVTAVGHHSLAFAGGKAWSWGANTFGQLGNGTTDNSSFALPVPGAP